MALKSVDIFTDGACEGNPGRGGWGAILRYQSVEKELSGFCPQTTNNRMELTAAIEALRALKEPCDVTLTTDSKYVADGINLGWAKKWQSNHWMKKGCPRVPNADLWEQLLNQLVVHNVVFKWVKGHAGHIENERCDSIATRAYLQKQ